MAFTSITGGLDWQAASFCNEFRGALSERRQAIDGAALADIAAGEDIQAVTFWKTFQDWQEANLTSFVDENATIVGTAAVTMWTTATWRTEAGIHSSGYRRATAWDTATDDWTDNTDAMFSYGKMQAGDIIGPWIFDDLQKGFDALNWTTKTGTEADSAQFIGPAGSAANAVCATARTTHLTDWTALSWGTAVNEIYTAIAQGVSGDTTDAFDGWRQRGKPYLAGISTVVAHSVDVYFLPNNTGNTFNDIDTQGMSDNQLWFYETLASATAATNTGTLFDPSSNSPVADMPLGCPLGAGTILFGIIVPSTVGVLKWTFVYVK